MKTLILHKDFSKSIISGIDRMTFDTLNLSEPTKNHQSDIIYACAGSYSLDEAINKLNDLELHFNRD